MSEISKNIQGFHAKLDDSIELIAVSKTKSEAEILEAYDAGQIIFGENRVQEIVEKQAQLPHNIQWHFIGHLQRNKVKFLVDFVDTIHSVDSFRLLKEINKQAEKCEKTIKCLLQFHIATEQNKFGFSESEISEMLAKEEFRKLNNIDICGVMGMATFTSDKDIIRNEFKALKKVFTNLKNDFFAERSSFKEISMGMSGDYKIALEEGATMLRIGSLIFGARACMIDNNLN